MFDHVLILQAHKLFSRCDHDSYAQRSGLDRARKAGKLKGGIVIHLRVFILPSLITKHDTPLQKIVSVMGKFSKVCANAEHEAWNNSSPSVINLHGKVTRNNIFSKHFFFIF